ncbi:MAG: hypothetical protein RL151_629 [Bacteroidota bacterium]|jgi:hypothetical protein
MKRPNRDLLVLFKDKSMSEQAIEWEVDRLNRLLFTVESPDHMCVSCEILDLDKRKVVRSRRHVESILKDKNRKPFIFVNNLN